MTPNKTLGQHFLTSKETAQRMVRIADITRGDSVLEVGPGKGVLTKLLLQTGAAVIAIEKDKRMVAFLKETLSHEKNLTLIAGDILKMEELKERFFALPATYSVVANLPYYITSHFLRLFLETIEHKPSAMTLMVQKEVAERIVACPPYMNVLALSVQSYGIPKKEFTVSRKQFSPPPDVDSAVISINNISQTFFTDNDISPSEFFTPIKKAFSSKRKMLRSSVGITGKFSTKRPQELTLHDWLLLLPQIKNAL